MKMTEAAVMIRQAKFRNWWFSVEEFPSRLKVSVGFYTEDSNAAYRGERVSPTLPVAIVVAIDAEQVYKLTPDRLGDWVYSHVKQALLHEAGEWFIWQGERPYYPHARSVGGAVTFP